MSYILGLTVGLALFWIGLSGYFKPLLLILGATSVLVSLWLTVRLQIIDSDSSAFNKPVSIIMYLPWLVWEIIKSNIVVIRNCLSSELDISPALVKVRSNCQSGLAKTFFANSITLTPGTVTVNVTDGAMLVHALNEGNALPESFSEMDIRAARAAGENR